ncbi:MAG TPA: hypothetical protein VHV49_02535 [Pseudonocardiaceae bacterium]|jgi:hypothetical protein|nr:hypothetical protein [Pseudonocardiaceae bacterium]
MGRITPRNPVTNVDTYSIATPRATHWRTATCAEVECAEFVHGFESIVDESTERGQAQAHYIRHDNTRAHVEQRGWSGPSMTLFTFPPGTPGFGHRHQVPNGRPELFTRRQGDWRGCPNPSATVRFRSAQSFVDDSGERFENIRDLLARG